MRRRELLAGLAASLAGAAARLPANKNIKWAVSAGLWSHFRKVPFTDILDIMRDTGFIGIRLTGFPGVLKTYDITASVMEREAAKRRVHIVTISFGGPAHEEAQLSKYVADAKTAMSFLKNFGASHLVVFSPGERKYTTAQFEQMCKAFNRVGEAAGEMGFKAGLHNHLNQIVEKPDEVDRCMALTDPKLFHFSPDTAHLHLGGSNVVEKFRKHKHRLMFMDYKDAKWTNPTADWVSDNGRVLPKDSPSAKFFNSIYDLGDGEIDFPGCHRVLKELSFKGWICVDLDTARKGPRASYERCGAYVVNKLEPIYL